VLSKICLEGLPNSLVCVLILQTRWGAGDTEPRSATYKDGVSRNVSQIIYGTNSQRQNAPYRRKVMIWEMCGQWESTSISAASCHISECSIIRTFPPEQTNPSARCNWSLSLLSPTFSWIIFKISALPHRKHSFRFPVVTAVTMKNIISWYVTPCSPVRIHRRFRGTYCPHLDCGRGSQASKPQEVSRTLKIEEISSSETLVNFYLTIER
jgi:hypothetical protein